MTINSAVAYSDSSSSSTSGAAATAVSIEQRLLDSVRRHYQVNHQAEFLRLKEQVESLLAELEEITVA